VSTAQARAVAIDATGAEPQDRGFFGHPRGLSTLFFTEMWERFSYYGMRGFLILYMTAAVAVGGLGLNTATAAAVYGTYTSLVYLMSLPGGWIADRLLGQRRAVLCGGILIACGHFSLAVPRPWAFFVGLALIVLGTGLLKPNISVIVGQLYAEKDIRRDAGFSVFYMGINLGAFVGPLITGFLAQDERFRAWLAGMGMNPNSSWHWGFGAAGVGMTLGLVQYVLGSRRLGDAGRHPTPASSPRAAADLKRRALIGFVGALVLAVAFATALATGVLPISLQQVTNGYSYVLLAIVIGFFAWLFLSGEWTAAERKRLYLIAVFFVAASLFWSVFEQAGSTLNLFADRNSNNVAFGQSFPSSWYQAANALFIIIFAPAFAWLWVRLGRRQPSSPTKFSFGLIGVGLGFVILVPAARIAGAGTLVSPMWLLTTYLIHTFAELCLSPVGLSSMTKLAPARIASLMMGVWFLATSVGDLLAGQAAGFYESMPVAQLLGAVAVLPIAAGIVMFLFRRPLTALIGDSA
jgi:proton-dependent oligopeptide transporter, POT family